MADGLKSYVREESVYDVHERHMPEIRGNRDAGLLELFRQSYAGWTQARPYPLPSERGSEAPASPVEHGSRSWDDIAAYVERSGSNSFVRTLTAGLSDLYELGAGGITRENWE